MSEPRPGVAGQPDIATVGHEVERMILREQISGDQSQPDHRPAYTAEITPTTMPKNSQMMPAPMHSENVAGMPDTIWSTTFNWLEYDTRSAVNSDFIMPQYCR